MVCCKEVECAASPSLTGVAERFQRCCPSRRDAPYVHLLQTYAESLTVFSVVLGRPGAGCSTLLKTLSNQRREFHAIDGSVYYNSFTPKDLHDQYRGDVIYCPEDDLHYPTLTIDQTIRFAAETRMPHNLPVGETKEDYVNKVCMDTT
jgi:ABC-type multidrug transport system ATPase subunit